MFINQLTTHRAIETRAVVVVVQSFDPTVAGLDRESAGYAFSREQFIPICNRGINTNKRIIITPVGFAGGVLSWRNNYNF